MKFAIIFAAIWGASLPTISTAASAQSGQGENSDRAAKGRAETEKLKALARENKVSLVEYYKRHHQIDMTYFSPPSAIIDLNLYHIMLAKMVEDKRISMEEFDYYSNKKTSETAERLTSTQR